MIVQLLFCVLIVDDPFPLWTVNIFILGLSVKEFFFFFAALQKLHIVDFFVVCQFF